MQLVDANVGLHPGDADAYDSLGEGQLAAGLRKAAIASYRKSLQLNPKNDKAIEILRKLGVDGEPDSADSLGRRTASLTRPAA